MAVSAGEEELEDFDLQRAWQDVLQAFAQQTKTELQPDRILTPEEVIGLLKARRDKEDADGRKYAVVKDVLGKSLACIQTLGGIAAQGASMVFGPTNLCFNAISYLITAGQNYNNIFSSLAELFKQVSDVLERFVIYLKMKEVDLPLRKIIHELLQSIVSICALSQRVLRSNKILKFLKVFAFNEDDGVNAELVKLRKLVERESQMKTTLTYQITKEGFAETSEALSEVHTAVDKLADESRKREMDSAEGKAMEKIKLVLGIQKEAEKQSQLHTRLRLETVEGTGKWLQEDVAFKTWFDRSKPYQKIVFLSADEGYGKTFLLSSVVRNLQRTYARQANSHTRTAVAYYYLLPQDSKAVHSDSETLFSVDRVVKTLALQLAQDPVYRKELSSVCETWVEPADNEELIAKLLDPCYKSDETFFLVVDGIDQADEKHLSELSQIFNHINTKFTSDEKMHVRILLSGRVEIIQRFAATVLYPSIVIDVASRSRPDIEIFIRDRLSSLKILEGDSAQRRDLRDEIFNSLSDSAHGDFINVDLLLKEIGTKQWPAEVREVLATAKSGFQRSDTIAREVARCNDSLSPKEIRDLNTLLCWVMTAKRTLTIKELNAALYLENKESSLRPLHKQIREKYSAFFHIDKDGSEEGADGYTVSLSSDSIQDHFKGRQDQETSTADSNDRIQEVEVKIIRRFLSSVCDESLYIKFGFDEFFGQKLGESDGMIHVNLENAPVTVLLGCLEAVKSSADELATLRTYAVAFWPIYLSDADLSMTTPADRVSIGKYLLSLFTDEEVMPRWWFKPAILSKHGWFFTDEPIDAVLNWLRDPAVTKSYTEKEKAWVKTLISNTSPDSDVLEHVAKFLARMLVTDSGWNATALYSTLQAFRTKIRHRKDSTVARVQKELTKGDGVSAEQIHELFAWAAQSTGTNLAHDYESNRCLARCLRLYGCYEEAVKQYQQTITLREDNWYAQWGLSTCYGDQEQWKSAIDQLQVVIQKVLKGEAQSDNAKNYLQNMRYTLAGHYRKVERFEEALKLYDDILEDTPTDYSVMYAKIQTFAAQEKYQAIIDLLDGLHSEIDPNFGISKIGRLVHTQWWTDDFDTLTLEASKKTNRRSTFAAAYNRAIDDASVPSYLPDFPSLKATWRVLLTYTVSEEMWKLAKTEEEKTEVVDLWEKLIPDSLDAGQSFLKSYIAKYLVNVYADRLRMCAPNSEEATDLTKKMADLATEDNAEQGAWESGVNTNFLLARWYRSLGQDEEARSLVRGTMKIGFDLLSDDDDTNDWEGMYRLGTVLMYYGDIENALAAWSLVGPQSNAKDDSKISLQQANGVPREPTNGDVNNPKEDSASTHSEDPKNENDHANGVNDGLEEEDGANAKEKQTGLSLSCDGECGKDWEAADDIYMCMDCLDVAFNEDCWKLLKAGELPINICNPKHNFLHVPKWDREEAAQRGKDKVRLRGENVPTAEWLRDLKKTWGFETVGAT